MKGTGGALCIPVRAALIATLTVIVAALSGCGETTAAKARESLTLRYASPYGPTHPFSRGDAAWIDYVERASNGWLRIEPYWGGSLMDEGDSVRELAAGVADVSYVLPIYQRAGAHFIRGQTPFYDGAVDMQLQNEVMLSLWEEFPQMRAELEAVKPLVVTGGSFLEVMTREKPVRTLADLRGLRLRAPAEITVVLDELGVDAEFMPMGEVYSALAKGTIDGVIAPIDTLKAMRFAEVVKYCTLVSIARGAYFSRAMNLASWQRLSPDLQAIVTASIPVWTDAVIDEITAAHTAGMQLAKERDVQFIRLPDSDMERFRAIYARMAQRSADALEARGLPGQAAYDRARRLIAASRAAQVSTSAP